MDATPGENGSRADGDVPVIALANILLRRWRLIVVLPLLFAVILATVSLFRPRTYVANAMFTPEMQDGGGAGGAAAALASQLGVGGLAGGANQAPYFYAELLRGNTVLRGAVESVYEFEGEGGERRRATLVDLLPDDAGREDVPPWRVAVEELRRDISVAVNAQTGVVQLTVRRRNPHLAEEIAERVLELLNEFNLATRRSQIREEMRFLASRLDAAAAELREAEDTLQRFLQQNRQFRDSPELLFTHDRLQRQVDMRQQIYTSLLEAHERAQTESVRDTPVLTIIEHPAESAEPEARGTLTRAAPLGFIIGLLLALLIAFGSEFTRRARGRSGAEYQEFRELRRDIWHQVRNPGRWVGIGSRREASGDR